MTTSDTEQRAAATREVLLDIWDGDAAKADRLMQRLRDAHANDPPDQQGAAVLHHAITLAAMLIQR